MINLDSGVGEKNPIPTPTVLKNPTPPNYLRLRDPVDDPSVLGKVRHIFKTESSRINCCTLKLLSDIWISVVMEKMGQFLEWE